MTKKEYQLIADAIREVECDSEGRLAMRLLVSRLITKFREVNPRFEGNWFLSECGF